VSAGELSPEEGSSDAHGHGSDDAEKPEMLHHNGHVLVHEPEPAGDAADEEHHDGDDPCRCCISGGGGRLRKATMAPPQKNAAATMQPAMIHKWVDSSIIGRPCQSSSMIIVGTETARTSSADPTMSAQPGNRGGRMRQQDRSGIWWARGSRGPGRHLGAGRRPRRDQISSGPRTATTRD
jgi:hypothetical protein